MAEAVNGWERDPGGEYISVLIYSRDHDAVRAWCCGNCRGDFLVVVGPRVIFQLQEDAALTTLWWRAEER